MTGQPYDLLEVGGESTVERDLQQIEVVKRICLDKQWPILSDSNVPTYGVQSAERHLSAKNQFQQLRPVRNLKPDQTNTGNRVNVQIDDVRPCSGA